MIRPKELLAQKTQEFKPLEIHGADGSVTADDEDNGLEPDTVPRECTDIFWLLPLLVCLGLLVWVTTVAQQKGDLSVYTSLPDMNGEMCGKGLQKHKPFLYFCMDKGSEFIMEGNSKKLEMYYPICLEKCPSTWNTSSRCWVDGRTSNGHFEWVQDYPTLEYIGMLCRPSKVYTDKVYSQFESFLESGPPVARTTVITRAWPTLLLAGAMALVASYSFIAAVGFCASGIILMGVAIVIAGTGCTSVYLFWCAKNGGCGMSEHEETQDFFGGAILAIVAFYFLCLACRLSEEMETAVQCITWSCKCVLSTPSLFLMPLVTFIAQVFALGWCGYVILLLWSLGLAKKKWLFNPYEKETWGGRAINFTTEEVWYLCFTFAIMIWIQGIITAGIFFVQAYVSQSWYFAGGMRDEGSVQRCAVPRAIYVGLRYHMGSLAKGGFIVLLALPLRALLGGIDNSVRDANPVGAILDGCCTCCLEPYRRHVKLYNWHVFFDLSLQGNNFCEAAHHVQRLWKHETAAVSVLNGATWLFQVVGIGVIGVVGHLTVAFEIAANESQRNVESPDFIQLPELLCVSGAVIAAFVSLPFMMIFDVVSDSILFCRTVQKLRLMAMSHSEVQAGLERACGSGFNIFLAELVSRNCAGRGSEDEHLLPAPSSNKSASMAKVPQSQVASGGLPFVSARSVSSPIGSPLRVSTRPSR